MVELRIPSYQLRLPPLHLEIFILKGMIGMDEIIYQIMKHVPKYLPFLHGLTGVKQRTFEMHIPTYT